MKPIVRIAVALLSCLAISTGALAQMSGGMGRMDTDGDGKISFAEFETSRLAQFKAIDTDGDSVLTAQEIDVWSKARIADMTARMGDADKAAQMMQRRVDALKKADTNGDGKITLDEFKADYAAAFKALDANGDGFLTADELKAAMRP